MKQKKIIKSLGLILLVSCSFQAPAQTFVEWFKQNDTQKKYLMQQLAALQAYAGYLRKGYVIASEGINTVKNISNGEFDLHQGFFNSLKSVNPQLKNTMKTREIIAYQMEIIKLFSTLIKMDEFSDQERSYIRKVKTKVLDEGGKELETLLLVITTGSLEMSDDERIERISEIHLSMKDKYAFTQSFVNDANILIRQRASEQNSINQLKKFYEYN